MAEKPSKPLSRSPSSSLGYGSLGMRPRSLSGCASSPVLSGSGLSAASSDAELSAIDHTPALTAAGARQDASLPRLGRGAIPGPRRAACVPVHETQAESFRESLGVSPSGVGRQTVGGAMR